MPLVDDFVDVVVAKVPVVEVQPLLQMLQEVVSRSRSNQGRWRPGRLAGAVGQHRVHPPASGVQVGQSL